MQNHFPHRRFAAAAFSDDRQGLAGIDVKGEPVDGAYRVARAPEEAARDREMFDEIGDFEQGIHWTGSNSPAKWQAALWLAEITRNAGATCRQTSRAIAHRPAKEQPSSGAISDG